MKSSLFYDSLFDLLSTFDSVEFTHVPRDRNRVADSLANEAITFDLQRTRYFNTRYWLSLVGSLFPV